LTDRQPPDAVGPREKTVLRISGAVLADMTAHARLEAPRECCGLLVGGAGRVQENVRTPNLEPGVSRFLVDPAAHFALIKRLRGTAREIVGAYHSHPRSGPQPSSADIAEAISDDFLCVIVSLAGEGGPVTRAYRFRNGEAEELRVLEDDAPA
jgi:proteasome lid subunit RPN8/RPN11